jgi:DnaJ-class molecular chaperone
VKAITVRCYNLKIDHRYKDRKSGDRIMHEPLLDYYIEGDFEEQNTTGPFKIDCAFCAGTGVDPASMKSLSFVRCPACEGQGIVEIQSDRKDTCTCTKCGGSGKEPDSDPPRLCQVCKGLGIQILVQQAEAGGG